MAATGTDKFRDALKNALKDKYPTPLSQWCKDWFMNSRLHAISDTDDPSEINKYSDVLKEEIIKEKKRVLLNDRLFRFDEIPFCYHYILSQWVQGDFLSNCTVVNKNVSEQGSLQNALEDLRKEQLDTALSDACENGHILVLLYTSQGKEYSSVNLEELLGIKKNSNVSVWSTENIFSEETEFLTLQEKVRNKKNSS